MVFASKIPPPFGRITRLFDLKGEICDQLFSGRSLRCDLYPLVEGYRFHSEIPHKIEYQLLVEAAVVVAGVEDVRAVDEHDLGGLVCNDAHGHLVNFCAGECLAEDLAIGMLGEDASVAEIVDLDNVNGSRKCTTII